MAGTPEPRHRAGYPRPAPGMSAGNQTPLPCHCPSQGAEVPGDRKRRGEWPQRGTMTGQHRSHRSLLSCSGAPHKGTMEWGEVGSTGPFDNLSKQPLLLTAHPRFGFKGCHPRRTSRAGPFLQRATPHKPALPHPTSQAPKPSAGRSQQRGTRRLPAGGAQTALRAAAGRH